jgi:hypothetical protein
MNGWALIGLAALALLRKPSTPPRASGWRHATPAVGVALLLILALAGPARAVDVSPGPIGGGTALSNSVAYGAISNTASETFFGIGTDGKIAAGLFNATGRRMRISLGGVYSTTSTASIVLKVKLCTVSGCGSGTVVQLGTHAAVLPGVALTNVGWTAVLYVNVFTPGSTATVDAQGAAEFASVATNANSVVARISNTAPSTVDLTVDQYISVSATWNETSSTDTITVRNFGAEIGTAIASSSGGAPASATYITQTASPALPSSQALSSLNVGVMRNTFGGQIAIYGGTACTNQFVRSLDASATATCASVAVTDVTNNVQTITTNYTATQADYEIRADTTAGAVTITLPASSTNRGKTYVLKNVAGANSLTVVRSGSDLIDGSITQTLRLQDSISVIADGTSSWDIF